jgi:hypothetical protein
MREDADAAEGYMPMTIGGWTTRLRRVRKSLATLSWTNLIAGMALGVIGYWLLARGLTGGSNQSGRTVEFGLGVLLGGIVSWVIPELINAVRARWFEQRPIRELLGPACLNNYATLIYLSSLYPKDSLSFLKVVPGSLGDRMEVTPKTSMPWVLVENDARALGYLMSVLATAGKSRNLSVIRDDLGLDQVEVNMICIGSIKSNLMTAAINSSFAKLPLRFAWHNDHLIITNGTVDWLSDEEFDYAILVKATNEYSPDLCVWICAGISHFGTASAAYFLFSKWRELHASFGESNFGLVLKGRKSNFKFVEIVSEARTEAKVASGN